MSLLAGDEPPAFSIEHAAAASGLVIACDHASNRIPAALGTLGLLSAELDRHIAWDIGAAAVATHLATLLDATLVRHNYSRLVIDCNRPLQASDSIPVQSEATPIPGNVNLSVDDRLARQATFFHPYHAALRDALDRRLQTPALAERTVLLSMHSFTPKYLGTRRPWHTGVMFQRDRRLGAALVARLRADAQLVVGENEPYAMEDASDYTLVEHGERRGIRHVGIEVRQDLVTHAADQRAWALRLAAQLEPFLSP